MLFWTFDTLLLFFNYKCYLDSHTTQTPLIKFSNSNTQQKNSLTIANGPLVAGNIGNGVLLMAGELSPLRTISHSDDTYQGVRQK